jgi:hypothetical protein
MHKDAALHIRLPFADRIALERAAQADDRPVGWLVRKIITDWLEAQRATKNLTAGE